MGRLSNIPTKKFIRFLEAHGCKCIRKRGSHWYFAKEEFDRPITISTNSKDLFIKPVTNSLKTLAHYDPERLKQLIKELESFK